MASTDHTPPGSGGEGVPPVDLDYELIRLIGRGAYGEVWLVRDKAGVYRAGKVVYRASFHHERPYQREYEGICKFEPVSRSSPSQVKILHVGRRDAAGCFYYIMELADDAHGATVVDPNTFEAKTLRGELLRRGRIPAGECIEIGLSLSAALENLHQHGLIHRDIKPANIIFVNNIPKLADIGLVTDADVTVSYVGTGGFIPPEGPGSPQADVYGLGKVLYEISTGQDRLEYPELPVDFAEWPDRELLLELNTVVTQACEPDAKKRYRSASALHADLRLLKRGKSLRQARTSTGGRYKVGRWLAAGAAILVTATLVHFAKKPASIRISAPAMSALPEASSVAEAETKFREKYQPQLDRGPASARQAAAADLVKQSDTMTDPAIQLAALRVATQLAIEAADFPQALQICGTIAGRFPIEKLPLETEMLSRAAGYVRTTAKYSELAGCCLEAAFESIAADDYDSGKKLSVLAETCSQTGHDARRLKETQFLVREIGRCGAAYAVVKPLVERLRRLPDDADANMAVGGYLCLAKNDWPAGLRMLAHSTNADLQAVATTELNRAPTTSDAQIALGNSWRNVATNLAGGYESYLARARYWYLKGVASAPASERTNLLDQFSDPIKNVPTEPGELHIYSRFVGAQTLDVYSDELRWRSGHSAVSTRINQVNLGDLKRGDLTIVKNNEATWLLPATVDFATARLIVNRKPKGKSHIVLVSEPDHARVTLSHPGNGYAEFEVTLVFGSPP